MGQRSQSRCRRWSVSHGRSWARCCDDATAATPSIALRATDPPIKGDCPCSNPAAIHRKGPANRRGPSYRGGGEGIEPTPRSATQMQTSQRQFAPTTREAETRLDSAAGREKAPPNGGASLSWWRWGESNPRPMRFQRRHLRAQPSASFRAGGLCWQVSLGLSQLSLSPSVLSSRMGAPCIALPGSGEAGTPRADRRLI